MKADSVSEISPKSHILNEGSKLVDVPNLSLLCFQVMNNIMVYYAFYCTLIEIQNEFFDLIG